MGGIAPEDDTEEPTFGDGDEAIDFVLDSVVI